MPVAAGAGKEGHPVAKRLPPSMRTRESLSDLIEGRLSSADGRAELVKLATRPIVEEALEGESRDALGRDYCEHGASPGQGWRNGVRMGRPKTAEGLVDCPAPQIAGRDGPFRSQIRETLKGRTQALEDLAVKLLARGPSVRDMEDAFRNEGGRLLLSRSAVSETGERLWADCEAVLPSATACFMDDFEACIAHSRMPIAHRRAIRTTNLLERLFVEERRRLKACPRLDRGTSPTPSAKRPCSSSCSAP